MFLCLYSVAILVTIEIINLIKEKDKIGLLQSTCANLTIDFTTR